MREAEGVAVAEGVREGGSCRVLPSAGERTSEERWLEVKWESDEELREEGRSGDRELFRERLHGRAPALGSALFLGRNGGSGVEPCVILYGSTRGRRGR